MNYYSTRETGRLFKASQVIKQGIAPEGGLFVPAEKKPILEGQAFGKLRELSYPELAASITGPFLDEFSEQGLLQWTQKAYGPDRFDSPEVAPLHSLSKDLHLLELWHGPTCAFKDMALQLMPYLLTGSMEKTGTREEIVILVATSGDTGKAALEGFSDVPGTKIVVFFPDEGVSEVQKKQMVTQEGSNVSVVAVRGNFDDTQTGVKKIFAAGEVNRQLADKGRRFSSANSINWGRLVPQIVYYFSSYLKLMAEEVIQEKDPVNFVVPTGNFGNILAGYYAKQMGLPVGKLICASNRNHILADFIRSGNYDANREFYRTLSPSMDILISSNLERLLFELTGHDTDRIRAWMSDLQNQGCYSVDHPTMEAMREHFWGDYADDRETAEAIRQTHRTYNYAVDTHTAVALSVYDKYCQETGDPTPSVVISTASPFKFNLSVSQALLGEDVTRKHSEFELLQMLSGYTGMEIPRGLQDLDKRPVLHQQVINKDEMKQTVLNILG